MHDDVYQMYLEEVRRIPACTPQEEEGLCRLADQWGAPLVTFSAEELEQVKAPVAESSFVRQVTGTGNVCERAALLGAGARGRLLVEKRAGGGVTVAVAVADYQVKEERGGF